MLECSKLYEFIKSGMPLIHVCDRDIHTLIYELWGLYEDTNSMEGEKDDRSRSRPCVYVFILGFGLVKVAEFHTPIAVKVKKPSGKKSIVTDPIHAIQAFMGIRTNIPIYPGSCLILIAHRNMYERGSGTSGIVSLLRSHYVGMTHLLTSTRNDTDDSIGMVKRTMDHADLLSDKAIPYPVKVRIPPPMKATIIIADEIPEPPAPLQRYIFAAGSIVHDYEFTSEKLRLDTAVRNMQDTNSAVGNMQDANAAASGLIKKEIGVMANLVENSKQIKGDVALLRKGVLTSNSVITELDTKVKLSDIGGYKVLKAYIDRRSKLIERIDKARELGVKVKGIALVGLPGTGKTMIAQAMADEWNLQAFSLNVNAAFGRYVGDSESRLLSGIESLERQAPCYAMINEADKVLAGVGEGQTAGSDVPLRLFGIILEAMERDSGVIFGVTANKATSIPQEFWRKGRFDKIFFLGLPQPIERAAIIDIHLRKRKQEPSSVLDKSDLQVLVDATDGFTGGEIESAINEAVVSAVLLDLQQVTYSLLFKEIKHCTTIQRNRSELKELETWAKTYAENAS